MKKSQLLILGLLSIMFVSMLSVSVVTADVGESSMHNLKIVPVGSTHTGDPLITESPAISFYIP